MAERRLFDFRMDKQARKGWSNMDSMRIVDVILNSILWMEEKYRDVPNGKIAAMIALHYLMPAIRSEYRTKPQAIEEHIAGALHWWKAASSDQCWNSPAAGQEGSVEK
jgi:hypothetical protein